jgi:GT2 family glycosyltransferase
LYRGTPGVSAGFQNHRCIFAYPSGGNIVTDPEMQAVWRSAIGDDIQKTVFPTQIPSRKNSPQALSAQACLAEAGLLERTNIQPSQPKAENQVKKYPVSAIIVSYNSLEWLNGCISSLEAQSLRPQEIIVVDNASQDGSAEWIRERYPEVSLLELAQSRSLASALNLGMRNASGTYYLLLNPDVELETDAIASMIKSAQEDLRCAAVAAKLRFSWAPAFLNGLGNHVGAFSWGTDSALGHLDLGQFDHWSEVPSACFAAALVPATAWKDVGPLDEGFPLYYEDSEWCYRARLLGYKILAAPEAIAYHAFSRRVPTSATEGLAPAKLHQVAYGRLRFAIRLLSRGYLARFLIVYFLEDVIRAAMALAFGRWQTVRAYYQAWSAFFRALPDLKADRRQIQALRKVSDRELFALQRSIPPPLVRDGLPQLTLDLVRNVYFPLMASGETRSLPEIPAICQGESTAPDGWLRRIPLIWRNEGLAALLHRLGRQIEWRLMQP